MTDDFYDLLDVPSDASQDDIKRAYREQVRIYHPDHNDDDRAQAQFTALQKAYEILGDPVERKAYDRLGHEDYVAKRTKGLPSPDVWRSSSDDSSTSERSSTDDERGEAQSEGRDDDPWATTGSSYSRTTAGGSGASADATGGSTSATGTATGANTTTDGTTTGANDTDGGTVGSSGPGGARTSGVGTATGSGSADGRGGGGANGSPAGAASSAGYASGSGAGSTRSSSRPGPLTDNAFVRWWRNRNFAWPLIWLAALTYLLGLGQFVRSNESAVRSLAGDLAAAGADANAVLSLLTDGRHGIDRVIDFVAAVELVVPPLPATQWYAALAGVVACSLLLVVAARVAWRRNTWGPVSIDETIVVSLALGTSTALVGGPLLAGTVLMPLLVGVVVHRTHALPGWSPSYAYVAAVAAPAAGLVAGALGYGSLAVDVVAFGLLPILGAVGLPVRVAIRKRFGR